MSLQESAGRRYSKPSFARVENKLRFSFSEEEEEEEEEKEQKEQGEEQGEE